jgi:hypothetical protein
LCTNTAHAFGEEAVGLLAAENALLHRYDTCWALKRLVGRKAPAFAIHKGNRSIFDTNAPTAGNPTYRDARIGSEVWATGYGRDHVYGDDGRTIGVYALARR